MHPLACAHGSVTLAESTRLLPSRDRQGAVSSEIPKTFKHPLADLGRHTHSWYWYNIKLIRQVLFHKATGLAARPKRPSSWLATRIIVFVGRRQGDRRTPPAKLSEVPAAHHDRSGPGIYQWTACTIDDTDYSTNSPQDALASR